MIDIVSESTRHDIDGWFNVVSKLDKEWVDAIPNHILHDAIREAVGYNDRVSLRRLMEQQLHEEADNDTHSVT